MKDYLVSMKNIFNKHYYDKFDSFNCRKLASRKGQEPT